MNDIQLCVEEAIAYKGFWSLKAGLMIIIYKARSLKAQFCVLIEASDSARRNEISFSGSVGLVY